MMNVLTMKQRAQDLVLRLFVESGGSSYSSGSRDYICSRCGTFARLHA